MENCLEKLLELDKKYVMLLYLLKNGKVDGYLIESWNTYKKLHAEKDEFRICFSSLLEGLKHAGKNHDDMVFISIEKDDSIIIDEVYKKFGGYVSLKE